MERVVIPRSFKLLAELESSEKGEAIPYPHTGLISYGLLDAEDITLTKWRASIIGPQNVGSLHSPFYANQSIDHFRRTLL